MKARLLAEPAGGPDDADAVVVLLLHASPPGGHVGHAELLADHLLAVDAAHRPLLCAATDRLLQVQRVPESLVVDLSFIHSFGRSTIDQHNNNNYNNIVTISLPCP